MSLPRWSDLWEPTTPRSGTTEDRRVLFTYPTSAGELQDPALRRLVIDRYADATRFVREERCLDALGCTRRSVESADDGRTIGVETTFTFRGGDPATRSAPYFCAGSADCAKPAGTAATSYGYDALGRVTSETYPLPSGSSGTRRVFHGDGASARWRWTVAGDDAVRGELLDWAGRPREVRECPARYGGTGAPGCSAPPTTYTYWQHGAVREIRDPDGIETEMVYDTLGRQLELVDPDAGTRRFEYDANGNLETYTGGNGAVTYTYDALDRVVGIVRPDRDSSAFAWDTYFGFAPAPGRPLLATTGSVSYGLAYDGYGRLQRSRASRSARAARRRCRVAGGRAQIGCNDPGVVTRAEVAQISP